MNIISQRLLSLSILLIGLGLYFPVYKKIYRAYTQSSPEYTRTDFRPCKDKYKDKYQKYHHTVPLKSQYKRADSSDRQLASQIGIALSPNGREIYELTDNGIKVVNRISGRQQNFELPSQFPRLSWGTDLAYDSQRDLISLVSLSGEGFLYRFDVQNRRWLDVRSLNNIDLQSLTYDKITDRYIAWADGNLVFISPTGQILYQEPVMNRLKGFNRLYDQDNESIPALEIAANGKNITLMTHVENSLKTIRVIWYYNLESKTTQLAYKSY